MSIEILNLNSIKNGYHIRYIKNHTQVFNIVTTLEYDNRNNTKYKPFKYSLTYLNPLDNLNNNKLLLEDDREMLHNEIIHSFANSMSKTLFNKKFKNDEFVRYCKGGYMNILYLKHNYKFDKKSLFIFYIIEIFDILYPFDENRTYEIFNSLGFYNDIII